MAGIHKLLPASVALVAASAQPVPPSPLARLEDHFEPLAIATDTLGVVLATQFQTSRLLLLVPWRLAVVTTPCPERSHQPAQPFPDRLALDDPVSIACRGPIAPNADQLAPPHPPSRRPP